MAAVAGAGFSCVGLSLGPPLAPAGAEVAGRATLLAQSPEGLWLIGEDGQQRLKLGHLPEQACLHPDGLLAYRSAQGDLGIYSFTRGSTVWSGRL